MAPRVGASNRILAPRLGNGIPVSFIFSLGANNFLVRKRLLAPRVDASKSKEILAPWLENGIPLFFLLSFLLVDLVCYWHCASKKSKPWCPKPASLPPTL